MTAGPADDRLDATLRRFLDARAADTRGMRTSSEIVDAIETGPAGQAHRRAALTPAWAAIVLLALLAALGVSALIAGSQRGPLLETPRGPTNGWIAYSTHQSRSASVSTGDIYLVRPGSPHRLVIGGDGTDNTCPAFSPDGTMLSYLRGADLMVVGVDDAGTLGETVRQRTLPADVLDACPRWAPDGTSLATVTQDGLLLIHLDGTDARLRWPDRDAAPGSQVTLAWSPVGDRIAVADGSSIDLMPLDGSPMVSVTGRARDTQTIAWSPDASMIAFDHFDTEGWYFGVTSVEGQGGGFGGEGHSPSWAPGGDRVAYIADGRVLSARLDGSDVRTIATGSPYGLGPWSPDGRSVLDMIDVGGPGWSLRASDAAGSGSTDALVDAISSGAQRNYPRGLDVSWQVVRPTTSPNP